MKRLVHGARRLPRPRGSLYLLAAILISMALFAACQRVYVKNDMTVYSGKVTFEGKPVAGAEVYLQIATGSAERLRGSHRISKRVARTGRDGSFMFTLGSLERNTYYSVFVRAKGYSFGGARLSTSMEQAAIDIELYRPAAIAGVVRSKDGAPLADVELGLLQYRFTSLAMQRNAFTIPLIEMTVRTDAQGRYRLEGVPAGSVVSLAVGKPGYVEMRSSATAGKTDHDITLAQAGSITGRALDAATGAPVESLHVEARVNLQNASGYGSAVTGKDGRYVIDDLSPGVYTVKCSPGAKQSGLCIRPIHLVTVGAGVATGLDLSLEKGILLSGIITDEITGKPVAGCPVEASSPLKEGDFPQYTREDGKTFTSRPSETFTTGRAITGSDGRFTVTTLPGHVFLWVVDPGAILRGSGRVTVADAFVEAGKKPADIAIAIPLEVEFPGRVFMPDGSPAAGVTVVAGTIPRIVTDRDGRFTLTRLTPGYEVTIAADSPKLGLEGSTTLTPAAGDSILIRLHPYRYTSVSGKVLDTNGKPIAGEAIELYLNAGFLASTYSQAAVSGVDGSFTVDSLQVGKRYSLGILGRMVESPLFVAGDPLTSFTLVMPVADRWLAGTVTDTQGRPASRARISLSGGKSGNREVFTDERGRFRLDRLAGEREIFNIFDSTSENGTVQEAPTNTDRVYVLHVMRRILGGQVLDTDGKPVPKARIATDQLDYNRRNFQATSNAQGRFYLRDLRGEDVTVTVTSDGYAPLTTTVATNREDVVFRLGK